ncbi:MAG: hypothetical protein ACI82H_000755 [Alphaproteobacteria bacterium]|jgi:hypothetical protein
MTMDITELLAAFNLLAEQLDHKPDDLHEVHLKIKEMINELHATGMDVPEDLLEFDRELTKRVEGVAD